MKKRGKKLLLLSLTFVLLCGAAFLTTQLSSENTVTEESSDSGVDILSLDLSTANSIHWNINDTDFSFYKEGDNWVYSNDSTFPLDQSALDTLFAQLSPLHANSSIEAVEDLSQYGLTDAACSLTVDDTQILIGSASPMDSQRYVSIGDGNVYLVDDALYSALDHQLFDLLQLESIPTVEEYLSVSTGTLTLTYDNSQWYADALPLDSALTEAWLENISGLVWTDCVDYKADDEQLSTYGLDSPRLCVTVSYLEEGESKSFSLEVGAAAGTYYSYARLGGSSMVYTIDNDYVEALMNTTAADLQAVTTES